MSNSLAKYAQIMFAGQLSKALFQGIAFIIIARVLGTNQFGVLISVLAICGILSPFIDFGSYHVIIKRLTHGETATNAVGEASAIILFTTPILLVILLAISSLFYGYPIAVLLALGLVALLFDKLLSIFYALSVATDAFSTVAYFETVVAASRALLAWVLYLVDGDLLTWSALLLAQGVVTLLVISVYLKNTTGVWYFFQPNINTIKIGLPFVWHQLVANTNQDLDKIIVTKISGADTAGIYAAANRVLNIVTIPLYSFYMTAYSRYFKASREQQNGFSHAVSMLPPSLFIGAVTVIAVYLLAPYVPFLLGESYVGAVELIRVAVWIPLIQAIVTPFADTLSGYGKQTARIYILLLALAINAGLMIVLIPGYGAYGAIYSTIASQAVFLIGCALYAFRYLR